MNEEQKPDVYKYDKSGVEDYRYATSLVVTNSPREFFISYVCVRPFEEARCVARLLVSEEHMVEMIAVFNKQLDLFRKSKYGDGSSPEGRGPRRF